MVDISKFLARAEEAYKKRNFQYAIQMYLEALQVDPANVEARNTLRSVLLKAVESGSKIEPPQTKTIMLNRDPKVMLSEYEKAVVKEPRNGKYNKRVAEALFAIGANEASGHVYQFVVSYCEKGSGDVEAMKKGAQSFINAGRPELAQKLLSMAHRSAPNDKEIADLQRNLAATQTLANIQSAGSSREMLKDSAQAQELELLNKKVLAENEIKQALAIVNAKLEKDPLDKSWVKKKAELYGKARQFDKAHEWLMSKYAEMDKAPDIIELAVRYKTQGYEFKIKVCHHKAKEEPEKAPAYLAKAKELDTEKHEFELREYGRQVDESPADNDKRYFFGKALFEAGRYEDAVPHLQRAARSPKYGKACAVWLGRCFTQLQRFELAVMQLVSALKDINEVEEELHAEARYWLADVYDKSGEKVKAKELFQSLYMQNAAFRDVGARLTAIGNV